MSTVVNNVNNNFYCFQEAMKFFSCKHQYNWSV